MSMRTTLLSPALLVLCAGATLAGGAIAADAPPPTIPPDAAASRHEALPLAEIPLLTMPRIDFAAVAEEDLERRELELPPRYAIPHRVTVKPATDGTWERIGKEGWLWRLRVAAPDATSINLGFSRYVMPPDGRLLISAADGTARIRPFTARDNELHGELWTPIVPTDEVVVEVRVPEDQRQQLELELTHVGYGYRGFGAALEDGVALSGSCNVDVICSEGDLWRDDITTVAVISTGGGTFCTGFMVNNTSYDLTPYFMTADHCGIHSGNAASLVTYWNYENSWCRPPGSPQSGGSGDGSLADFNTGSFFRAAYGPSDMTLVELDDDPDPEWSVGYAGWDATGADADWAVAIHHPNTDEKRISFEDQPTTTTSYLGEAIPGNGTHVRVEDWDIGTTEPGSSGSPLFDQNHRIIGQLHGGYASCSSQTSDWYGKMSVSWTGGGSPSTSLAPWLDAAGTGMLFVDTISGLGMSVVPGGDVMHIGEVGGPFAPMSMVYTMSNPSPDPVDYEVRLGAGAAPMLIDGGTGPVTGTIAPLGGTTTVTVSLDDPGSLAEGTYTREVIFEDLTNAQLRVRNHVIEAGMTLISVGPDDELETGGALGGPFEGSITYTITNERPSPVMVEVTGSEPWISLDGDTDPLLLTLSGLGETVDVVVGISEFAEGMDAGVYAGSVQFTNLNHQVGNTTRGIALEVGRVVFASADPPLPITDNNTTTSIITIGSDFCVGDMDVDLDLSHTYVGDLIVELESPAGTVVRLHDRTGGSSNDLFVTYDDSEHMPDGPGVLADFNDAGVLGDWILTVSDNAGQDQGTLNSWALRIVPCGPIPQPVYSFSLDTDPGWSMEGLWAFGPPTGSGGANQGMPDPTSGHTGTNVLGYNLDGDYGPGIMDHLTSAAIDCTGLTNVELAFRRWLNVDTQLFDLASVSVSNDGVGWATVWMNGMAVTDSSWQYMTYDISAVADDQPAVYVRWTMGPTNAFDGFSGWNLDDIEIWADEPPPCPADLSGNGVVDFADILAVIGAWGPCVGCPQDVDGDDMVAFSDILAVIGAWGACP
ncbi:MAG: hypothetical protein GY715_14635 [Planctomycetes bacterium]|nr:hypothetical protein [Planctomycetota bacterium]